MDSAQGLSEVRISEMVMQLYHCAFLFSKNLFHLHVILPGILSKVKQLKKWTA